MFPQIQLLNSKRSLCVPKTREGKKTEVIDKDVLFFTDCYDTYGAITGAKQGFWYRNAYFSVC